MSNDSFIYLTVSTFWYWSYV